MKKVILGVVAVGVLAVGGFLAFFVCAVQVYVAKLTGRGAVRGGLYRFIRHPQYSAFAVCGFGLLLLWQRHLTLVMFVSLLFAYYLLARAEERECARKYGQIYQDYVRAVPMFLPFKVSSPRNAQGPNRAPGRKALALTAAYAATLACALLLARQLKAISSESLHAVADTDSVSLAIFRLPSKTIAEIVSIARTDPDVVRLLEVKDPRAMPRRMINYILPENWYISEIPMNEPVGAACHVFGGPTETGRYRVIFTEAKESSPDARGSRILVETRSTRPIIEALVDLKAGTVIAVAEPSLIRRYGNMLEPVF
jgi:hypothetical protein